LKGGSTTDSSLTAWPSEFRGKAKDLLSELRVDVSELSDVRMRGTLDHVAVTVNGSPIEERSRLRDIGRRLRERALR
jgi:hypothetical protein